MNDDQTQALVTARLLSAARPAAAANVLLAALAAQYGGPGLPYSSYWPPPCFTATSALRLTAACLKTSPAVPLHARSLRCRPAANRLRRSFPERTAMPQRSAGALALWRKSLYLTAAQAAVLLIQAV
ncbi:hypothetical protein [Kingella potus]|uniref:hypothetical protein n=1 Tax=Kingella potus TaxID=265175 RepID=UPI003CC7FB5A